MNKYGHVTVTKRLTPKLKKRHDFALRLGSIMPDILLHTYIKGHTWDSSYHKVPRRLQRLERHGRMNCFSFLSLGYALHYIEDYFTFPHNRTFDGSLRQHNTYEKHLKNELKAFVESGRADVYAEKNLRFDTLNQLLDYIRERHNVYLDRKRSIEEDIHYILSVCFQVFQGLFQLCLRAVSAGVPAVNI